LILTKYKFVYINKPFRLTWYCYGPPAGTSRPEFHNTGMFHLQYVKATPREMMEEELTEHVAKTGKINRRKHRSTNGLKNKNESDSSDSEAVGSTGPMCSIENGNDWIITKKAW